MYLLDYICLSGLQRLPLRLAIACVHPFLYILYCFLSFMVLALVFREVLEPGVYIGEMQTTV